MAAALQSKKKIVVVFGGIGSGKTTTGSLWTLGKSKSSPIGSKGLIAANSYMQLVDSTISNFYETVEMLNLRINPRTPPNNNHPFNICIPVAGKRQVCRCRSLENYKLIEGAQYEFEWLDETRDTKKAAFDICLGRARSKRVPLSQIFITTTLDEDPDGSWLYEVFVKNFDPAIMDVFYAPTSTNIYLPNLQEYIQSQRSLLSPTLFRSRVECIWTNVLKSVIYTSFSRSGNAERKGNVSDAVHLDDALPLYWTHDFNVGAGKPMSSCFFQIKRGVGPGGKPRNEVHVIDEIIQEDCDTNKIIPIAIEKFGTPRNRRFIIHGDAAGHSKDSRSGGTDYTILSNAGFVEQRVPRANPPIRDRHNAVNSMLHSADNDVRVFIHPRAKTLIRGLEIVGCKKGSAYQEEERYEQHVTTAFGYAINVEFPIQVKSSSGKISVVNDRIVNGDGFAVGRTDYASEFVN